MKRSLSIVALTLLGAAAGCSSSKTASSSLQPAPAVAQLQPMPADQSVPAPQPMAAVDTSTPASPTPISTELSGGSGASYAATGGSYTVRPGDTLYRIALTHYGDGKQWKKIIAANPGISPTKLRVGQVITLP